MNDPNASRYARQLVLPEIGETGQQRLAQSSMVIVGLGGLGCPAALYLASCGVGQLTLCDHDSVDASNLARQTLYADGDIGKAKVSAASAALRRHNPALKIKTRELRITTETLQDLAQDCDVLIDASDNYATRLAVNQACLATATPWVMGAAIRSEGQLLVLRPGESGYPCYQCAYGDAAGSLDDCQGSGVFATVTGIIGAAMANEAVRLLLKPASIQPILHLLDAWSMDWRQLRIKQRNDCPACRP